MNRTPIRRGRLWDQKRGYFTLRDARVSLAMGDRGCLSLFGRKPTAHRLLADQITAEYRVKTTGRGRTVDEWKARPGRPDNHWLDCLVGCAVGASIQGAALPGMQPVPPARRRKRYTQEDLDRRFRAYPAGCYGG